MALLVLNLLSSTLKETFQTWTDNFQFLKKLSIVVNFFLANLLFFVFRSSICFVVQVVIQDPSMCYFVAWPLSAMTCVLVGLGVGLPVSTYFSHFFYPSTIITFFILKNHV